MTRKLAPRGSYDEEAYELVREGILEIDECGRIWRLKRWQNNRWGHPSKLVSCDRRRAENTATVYPTICVKIVGVGNRSIFAHRLVWRHFNGPIPKHLTVNHEDGVKRHNHPSNFELATSSEQMIHSVHVLGNIPPNVTGLNINVGAKNGSAKLKEPAIKEIRSATGYGVGRRLAKKYDVSAATIHNIRAGKNWKHV